MHLKIIPRDAEVAEFYRNHNTSYSGDAGLNLFFPDDVIVQPGETVSISLGIRIAAYSNKDDTESISFFCLPRSSISNTPLRFSNSIGLIDAGYRGVITTKFDNIKTYPYHIKKGDKLVQIAHPSLKPGFTIEIVDKLSETVRGDKSYGSSGR